MSGNVSPKTSPPDHTGLATTVKENAIGSLPPSRGHGIGISPDPSAGLSDNNITTQHTNEPLSGLLTTSGEQNTETNPDSAIKTEPENSKQTTVEELAFKMANGDPIRKTYIEDALLALGRSNFTTDVVAKYNASLAASPADATESDTQVADYAAFSRIRASRLHGAAVQSAADTQQKVLLQLHGAKYLKEGALKNCAGIFAPKKNGSGKHGDAAKKRQHSAAHVKTDLEMPNVRKLTKTIITELGNLDFAVARAVEAIAIDNSSTNAPVASSSPQGQALSTASRNAFARQLIHALCTFSTRLSCTLSSIQATQPFVDAAVWRQFAQEYVEIISASGSSDALAREGMKSVAANLVAQGLDLRALKKMVKNQAEDDEGGEEDVDEEEEEDGEESE